jgi:hypothetical protein
VLNGSGELIVPIGAVYEITYNVTVFYGGSSVTQPSRIDSYIDLNGSLIPTSHVAGISVADDLHQYIQGTTFMRRFNNNDVLAIRCLSSTSLSPPNRVPDNTSSISDNMVTACINIRQINF